MMKTYARVPEIYYIGGKTGERLVRDHPGTHSLFGFQLSLPTVSTFSFEILKKRMTEYGSWS